MAPGGEALYVGDAGHLIKIMVSDERSEHVAFHATVSINVRGPVQPPKLALAGPGSLTQPRSVLDPRLSRANYVL